MKKYRVVIKCETNVVADTEQEAETIAVDEFDFGNANIETLEE